MRLSHRSTRGLVPEVARPESAKGVGTNAGRPTTPFADSGRATHGGRATRRKGVVLLLVMVVVVLLTLAAYEYNELMTAEYKAADSATRVIQVRALADSGVYYAASVLSDPSAFSSILNNAPLNSPQAFQGVLVQPHDSARFRGRFNIVAPPDPDEPPAGERRFRYGVTDEAGKINLNALMALDNGKTLHDMLMALPNMTEEIADAILDWMDTDNKPRPHGAEDEYYQALNPPYHCKNGPLDSLEELLLVRGVTPELLFGNDRNRNGVLDPDEDDGSGFFYRGWSAYLTIYSREQNLDSQNNPRIYVNSLNVKKVYERLSDAVGPDMAYYIAAYRLYGPAPDPLKAAAAGSSSGFERSADSGGSKPPTSTDTTKQPDKAKSSSPAAPADKNKKSTTPKPGTQDKPEDKQPKEATRQGRDELDFERHPVKSIASLYELIGTNVNVTNKQGQATRYACPLNDPDTLREVLPALVDKATTSRDSDIPARININTAPLAVLAGLPGMTDSDVLQNLLEHRPNPWSPQPPDSIFQSPAWLITEANFSPEAMKKLDKYITTRSQSYRVQVLGYFDSATWNRGGPITRVEAVIDTNAGRPRIVYWRDLTDLGQGFNLER